jgi:hypothetical protein
MKEVDSKRFLLHFVAVIDNPEVNVERVREQLSRYISRYRVDVKIYAVTLSDLKNQYQYSS